MLDDPYGRTFKKLRVSLTHECNYACLYCADESAKSTTAASLLGNPIPAKKSLLPVDGLIKMISNLHAELQLDTVRLTGGEPMLYPDLLSVVSGLKNLGIPKIAMTTNGHQFYSQANALKAAGLSSVNISIDALEVETFKKMSRNKGLENVLRSIDKALEIGLELKLNTVVLKGINDSQILALLEFAMNKGILIRFLELMPMGPLHQSYKSLFFSESSILDLISKNYKFDSLPKEKNATAHYWSINQQKAFGIIANDSTPFCSDCDRLRLDSYGNIYGCLSSLKAITLKPDTSAYLLSEALTEALTHKQQLNFKGNHRTMQSIGG